MNFDFVNKALDQAKQLQQTVAEAVDKTAQQAQPLIADAVTRAQDLQKSIAEQAPQVSSAAQAQLQAASGHLGNFITIGKEAMTKGAASAADALAPLAENARAVVHSAASAVSEATAPKPPSEPPAA